MQNLFLSSVNRFLWIFTHNYKRGCRCQGDCPVAATLKPNKIPSSSFGSPPRALIGHTADSRRICKDSNVSLNKARRKKTKQECVCRGSSGTVRGRSRQRTLEGPAPLPAPSVSTACARYIPFARYKTNSQPRLDSLGRSLEPSQDSGSESQ